MCTALFAFGVHPHLLFFLAFNRDEFLDRPTEAAHWWEDEPEILAGRDGERKGTWLGISRRGRFAFLTNFREAKYNNVTDGPSRGALPVEFLKGTESPMTYLRRVNTQEQNGFNLVVGDLVGGQVAYLTNRGPHDAQPAEVSPGIHGLSNGVLNEMWPKVEKGKLMLEELLHDSSLMTEGLPWDTVFDQVMLQCEKVRDRELLPQTGVPIEVEEEFSSIVIHPTNILGSPYGTRVQTVIAGWESNSVELQEKTLHLSANQQASGMPAVVSFQLSIPITDAWRTE